MTSLWVLAFVVYAAIIALHGKLAGDRGYAKGWLDGRADGVAEAIKHSGWEKTSG